MQYSDHSLNQKQVLPFAVVTVFGIAALLLGLALIIFAHYHERAYVFLGLGAAGFIGGIAGIVGVGSKVKAALSYGAIALGIMAMIVGVNYLVVLRYQGAYPLLGAGTVCLIVGIACGIFAQSRARTTSR